MVLVLSAPVVLVDEVLKLVTRRWVRVRRGSNWCGVVVWAHAKPRRVLALSSFRMAPYRTTVPHCTAPPVPPLYRPCTAPLPAGSS